MIKSIYIFLLIILLSSISYSQARLSAQLGVGVPTSDFAEDAGTGFGVSGTFEYVQNPIAYTFSLGFFNFGTKDNPPPGTDISWKAIPIMLGLRYYFSSGSPFHPYLGAELGLNILETSITEIRDKVSVEYSTSESKFGLNPMFGFRYTVQQPLDIELTFKYHIITSDPSTTFFGIMFGLNFGL
ncbi:MAG TPA: outer membrane beta-barrel protein [Ignavibacteriaceae bacterium]|nr:outer membrane beta-barrel protein [Ignavibacteriaceae bacterium]